MASLVPAAWRYRHSLTAADALYVALAAQLGASVLTDDQSLANSPALPPPLSILGLSGQGEKTAGSATPILPRTATLLADSAASASVVPAVFARVGKTPASRGSRDSQIGRHRPSGRRLQLRRYSCRETLRKPPSPNCRANLMHPICTLDNLCEGFGVGQAVDQIPRFAGLLVKWS